MSGNKIGGEKAAAKNRSKYGADFYARIGKMGGSKTGQKGFAVNRDLARRAGAKGGRISRRGKAVIDPATVQVDATTKTDDKQTDFDLAAQSK